MKIVFTKEPVNSTIEKVFMSYAIRDNNNSNYGVGGKFKNYSALAERVCLVGKFDDLVIINDTRVCFDQEKATGKTVAQLREALDAEIEKCQLQPLVDDDGKLIDKDFVLTESPNMAKVDFKTKYAFLATKAGQLAIFLDTKPSKENIESKVNDFMTDVSSIQDDTIGLYVIRTQIGLQRIVSLGVDEIPSFDSFGKKFSK